MSTPRVLQITVRMGTQKNSKKNSRRCWSVSLYFLPFLFSSVFKQNALGLKGEQRARTRAMPIDRKYILHKQFKANISPRGPGSLQSGYASYGPSSAAALIPKLIPQLTGDNGLISRMSIVGWGSSSTAPAVITSGPNGSNGEFSPTGSPKARVSKVAEEMQPLQPQSTGSLWSSWWASSGGDKSSTISNKNGNKETTKSAKWYIDGLRIGKTPDMKLVTHLITLRVHLSTAKLAFIQDFIGVEKGLASLGILLAGLVGKGGKRKVLSELEVTVLLEILKCLRVLLNTDVSILSFLLFLKTSHRSKFQIVWLQ